MPTRVIAFPFDLFGNAGCGAGATLLLDTVAELIDDTERESRPTRTHAITDDLEIEEYSFDTMADVERWAKSGAKAIREAMKQADFTLWLGGNHLSVLPVYEALTANDLVIQFDAHLDIFDLHDTHETLSHGNFLRHAKSLPAVINLGHRDLIIPEMAIRKVFRNAIPANQVTPLLPEVVSASISKAKRVWIDIDVDVFDPAYCPAVHQRTPFGLAPLTLLALVESVLSTGRVVGCSLSEFDPGQDANDASLSLLAWFIEWLLLRVSELKPDSKSL